MDAATAQLGERSAREAERGRGFDEQKDGCWALPTVLRAEDAFKHMCCEVTDPAIKGLGFASWKYPSEYVHLSCPQVGATLLISLPRCPVLVSRVRDHATQAVIQKVILCLVLDDAKRIEWFEVLTDTEKLETCAAELMWGPERPRAQHPRVVLSLDLWSTTWSGTELLRRLMVRVGKRVLGVPPDVEFLVVGCTERGVLVAVLPGREVTEAIGKPCNWALVFEVGRDQHRSAIGFFAHSSIATHWTVSRFDDVIQSRDSYLEAVDCQPRGDIFDDAERERILNERLAASAYDAAAKGGSGLAAAAYDAAMSLSSPVTLGRVLNIIAKKNTARLRWGFAAMTRTGPLVLNRSTLDQVIARKNMARLRWFAAVNDLVLEQWRQERELLISTVALRRQQRDLLLLQNLAVMRLRVRCADRALCNVLSAWRLHRPWERRKWRRLLRSKLMKARQSAVHWRDISKELSRSLRQAASRWRDTRKELSHSLSEKETVIQQKETLIQRLETLIVRQEAELLEKQKNMDGMRKALQKARGDERNRECWVCLEVSGFPNRPWHQFTECEHYSVCEHCMQAQLVNKCLVCEPNMP